MSRDPPDAGPPMLMDASNRLLHVYGKTPAGTAALRADRGAMPTQARRILILIDGKRSVGDLARIFPAQTLETALAFLDQHHYIECLQHFAPGDGGSDGQAHGREFTTTARPGMLSHLQRRHYLLALAALISLALLAYAYDSMSLRPPPHPARPAAALVPSSPAAAAATGAAPASSSDTALAPGNVAAAVGIAPVLGSAAPPPDTAVAPVAPDGALPTPAQPAPALATQTPANQLPEAPAAAPAAGKTLDKNPGQSAAGAASDDSLAARARKAARKVLQATVTPEAPAPAAGLRQVPVLPGFVTPAPHAPVPPALDAAPASAPALRVRSQVPPQLPQQARDLGISSGRVVVVLHVNPGGTVDSVELVSATPPQVYDAQMRHAFEDWTFDPPGVPGRMTVEIVVGTPPHPAQP